jgi:hypothetical protein
MDWVDLAQNWDHWSAIVIMVNGPSVSSKYVEILEYRTTGSFLRRAQLQGIEWRRKLKPQYLPKSEENYEHNQT